MLVIQLLLVLLASLGFFVASGGFKAGSACFGGAVAMVNVLLLEWRRTQADRRGAMTAGQSLRVVYRSVFERLVLVAGLFVLGMGVLRLDPLALLAGFIAGQVALIMTGIDRD